MSDILERVRTSVHAYKALKKLLTKDYTASGFIISVYQKDNVLATFEIRGEDKDPIFKEMIHAIEMTKPLRKSLLQSTLRELEDITSH